MWIRKSSVLALLGLALLTTGCEKKADENEQIEADTTATSAGDTVVTTTTTEVDTTHTADQDTANKDTTKH